MNSTFKQIGRVRVHVDGTQIEAFLNRCIHAGIELKSVVKTDEYAYELEIFRADLETMQKLAVKCYCQCGSVKKVGYVRCLELIKKRASLMAVLLVSALCVCISSLFIWNVSVEGNCTVTEAELKRCAEKYGVKIGAYWPKIDGDMVRCGMMNELENIGWVGVVVKGSTAAIQVLEREKVPEIYSADRASDIAAGRDGVIVSLSVRNGRQMVNKGETAVKGQVLISGIVDSLSNDDRYVNADGIIMARTWYELTAVSPNEVMVKKYTNKHRHYSLCLGKKRINFYLNSGKMIDGCDKITTVYTLGIKGVFMLPVSVCVETYIEYELEAQGLDDVSFMESDLRERISSEKEILFESCVFSHSIDDGLFYCTVRTQCVEDIGEKIYYEPTEQSQ